MDNSSLLIYDSVDNYLWLVQVTFTGKQLVDTHIPIIATCHMFRIIKL